MRQEEARLDAAELDDLVFAAQRRRRRTACAIAAVVLGGFGGFIALASLSPPPQALHCHHVQIQWENAPEVPGPGWTACDWH